MAICNEETAFGMCFFLILVIFIYVCIRINDYTEHHDDDDRPDLQDYFCLFMLIVIVVVGIASVYIMSSKEQGYQSADPGVQAGGRRKCRFKRKFR